MFATSESFLIFALILLIAGPLLAVVFYYKWRKVQRVYDLMDSTKTSPIAQLKSGPAEVRGRTSTTEQPLISPWCQQPCVFYEFHVEQEHSSENSTYWKTYIKDEQSLPFVVKDDTGQAVVDSSKIKLVVEEDRFSRSGFMNDADSDLQQLLESRYNKKTKGWIFNKTLRYTERALELDEEVYVFGDASRLGDGWVLSDGEMPLIVSDKGGAAIEQSYSSKITWLKIGTAIAAAAGVAGLFILLI